ncbi:saccharopine dehydrogenase [Umezawaea sp. Da 62-37]|uniref:saccharopine dehydrogenase n=1 Tax=Umezawaea sp. Da 62-37 TaxID=3075927 RepID=UPI0028F6E632|nr:saccharopine dehydrogenase [Umezawaea sp. Da 62-37]WNV85122.1 saccharopine dehydrogenase [Umezawaea sp. Da 62-37]
MTGLRLRAELRPGERRAPLTPHDAGLLVADGVRVTVEDSPHRVFPTADYAATGCLVAEPGSWVDAPDDEIVLGLKELPDHPTALRHRHMFFGHAYKGQVGAAALLTRFTEGGGTLLDLEYLTDDKGRRLAAFGYWAGYVGAAMAVLHHRGRMPTPLEPMSVSTVDALLAGGEPCRAIVIGALGRCGHGAVRALSAADLDPTLWDLDETRDLDRQSLLDNELLVNTVLTRTPVPPFLTKDDLSRPHRLTTIADVSCDVGSACNVLPIYDRTTDWRHPARRVHDGPPAVDVIAIDNLPSLVPLESSTAFSADLVPHLRGLADSTRPWRRCADLFATKTSEGHADD